MGDDILRQRSRALEEAFFAKRDRAKLDALRAKLATEAKVAALAAASGIEDHAVLEVLIELDIGADTYAALSLVPLIEVAWADGSLDNREREAVLRAAANQGLREDQPAYALLASWLDARPGPELRRAWFEYMGALLEQMPPDGRRMLQTALLGGAEKVAEATGGFLGLGDKVSDVERAVLDELAGAFQQQA